MSMAPATARSSSSQSSSESWQPSQDENFHTASLGFLTAAMSELPYAEDRAQLLVGEDRPVAADEGRAELAVAAEADGAFHVALHGDVHGVGRNPGGGETGDGKSHHHLRPADQGDGIGRIEGGAGYQRGDHADTTTPVAAGMVDRH